MIKRYNFSIDAWVIVEVEGDSEEDCDDQLRNECTLEDIARAGDVKEWEIRDLEETIIEEYVNADVYNIVWSNSGMPMNPVNTARVNVYVANKEGVDENDVKDAIQEELEANYDGVIDSFDYDTIEVE